MPRLRILAATSALWLLSLAVPVLAGTINYVGPTPMGGMTGWEDFANGGTVWYGGVSESNNGTGPASSLFNAPTNISGNSIDFNPTFSVSASGPDANILDGQLNFMVTPMSGKVIDNLLFTEAGDTTLAGIGIGGNAISKVTAKFFVDVLEVDGSSLLTPLNIIAEMDFTPVGATAGSGEGRWSLNDDGDTFTYDTFYAGDVFIDINDALVTAGIDFQFGATKLNVAVDNTLTAIATAPGYSAFIAKKDFDGLTVTTNVPEPGSVFALTTLLCVGVAGRRRRRC